LPAFRRSIQWYTFRGSTPINSATLLAPKSMSAFKSVITTLLAIDGNELRLVAFDFKLLSMATMTAPLSMRLKIVEEILAETNDVPPNADKAFRSRLAHLQRSGFPAASRVGKFARASYGLDELLQLSVVFALVQAYVPPVVGRRIVTDFWPEIAQLLLAAMADREFEGVGQVPQDAPFVMTILPRALRDMGNDERSSGKGGVDQGSFGVRLHRGREKASKGDATALRSPDDNPVNAAPVATISLDFRIMADRLIAALGTARADALAASLQDLAVRFGWQN